NADENIALGSVQTTSASATAVTIDTTEGGVTDAGDTDVDIIANGGTVVINAVTGVGSANALETTIGTLDVDNSTSGNIGIVETDAITLAHVSNANGSVTVDAGNTLTATDVNASGATFDVTLTTTTGGIVLTQVIADDDIFVTADAADITLGVVGDAGTDDITIEATLGSINEIGAGDAAVDVVGDAVTLTAQDEIGGAGELDIETTIASLDASATSAGDIVVTETNALDLTAVDTVNGALILIAGGNISDSGTVSIATTTSLSAGTADIILDSAANNFVGEITVLAAANVQLDDANSMVVGNVTATGNVDLNIDRGGNDAATLTLTGVISAADVDVDGQNTDDTLIASNVDNVFTVTGAEGGTLAGAGSTLITFTDISNLTGGTANDTFQFADAGSISGDIADLGGANDTLIADDDGDNDFDIDGLNTGTLTETAGTDAVGGTWSDIENLTGGDGNDTFTYAAAGVLSGNIRGGTHPTLPLASQPVDALDISDAGLPHPMTVQVGAPGQIDSGTSILLGNWDELEDITLGSGDIVSAASNATWRIFAANEVEVSFDVSPVTFVFTGIANLLGGDYDDTFIFESGGSLTGTIDGGAANLGLNQLDVIDISDKAGANTIDLTPLDNPGVTYNTIDGGGSFLSVGFIGVEEFEGDGVADTLISEDLATVWTIDGADEGESDTGFFFEGISNLTGSSVNDSFIFEPGGSLSGVLDGGASTDTINVAQIAGANTVNLQTTSISGLGGISVNLDYQNAEDFIGDNTADVLTILDGGVTVNITGQNDGNVSGNTFTDFPNINGGTGDDVFAFVTAGSITGTLDGGGGTTNTLSFSGSAGPVSVTMTGIGTLSGFLGNLTHGGDTANFDNITDLAGSTSLGDLLLSDINADGAWAITGGANTFTGSGRTMAFSGVEDLTGDGLIDTFTVTGAHTGNLSGGDGADVFTLTAGTLTGNIAGGNDDDVITLVAGNITGSVAGDAGNDTLAGNTAYTVNAVNGGTAASITLGFVDVENLVGTAGNNTFTIAAGGQIVKLNGLGGSDTINWAAKSPVMVTLTDVGTIDGFKGTSDKGISNFFDNVEAVVGGSSMDTLTTNIPDGTFIIQGANGTYEVNPTLTFTSFELLNGSSGADTFVFQGNHSTQVDGGAGDDTFTFDSGTVSNIVGGFGNDTYTFSGGSFSGGLNIVGDDTWNYVSGRPLGSNITGAD
ncbi:MAG: acrosin, partial [Gammaproteobacteria bacterium]